MTPYFQSGPNLELALNLDLPSLSPSPLSRRDFLWRIGGGFGGLALSHLFSRDLMAGTLPEPKAEFNGGLHHRAKVKRVIQLFMNGGVSQMDTYDYKPELARLHGQMIGPKEKPEGFTAEVGAVMKSPFEFKQYGQTKSVRSWITGRQPAWLVSAVGPSGR
jgi:hypothetical protein